jgi:hypothetical protein
MARCEANYTLAIEHMFEDLVSIGLALPKTKSRQTDTVDFR